VHGGDQSNFVAADIKDCEFPDLVGVRKCLTQLYEVQKSAFPNDAVPMGDGRLGIWMLFSELVQSFSRDDVHSLARDNPGKESSKSEL
jgi:hypothetical protein